MSALLEYTLATPIGADRAWSVVGEVAGLATWVPGLETCVVDGNRRVCTFADGRVQNETIESIDDDTRSYAYSVDVTDTPMARNEGKFRVDEMDDGSSMVRWTVALEFAAPETREQILPMLREGYGAAFTQLAQQLRL